jgi:dienelactone hydrolase
LTDGVCKFADDLRAAGHTVHTPDLYEGRTFTDIKDGVANARSVGFEKLAERGRAAAADLPQDLVYAGMSMGVGSAQELAQTRPGAKGALLMFGALPPSEFGPWPDGVPLQIHAMRDDPWFKEDAEAAQELATSVPSSELFLYPGDKHLFADSSLADYDEGATKLAMQRVLGFLKNI